MATFTPVILNSTWKCCGLLSASKILTTGLHLLRTKKSEMMKIQKVVKVQKLQEVTHYAVENKYCLLVLAICLKEACVEVDASASSGCGTSITSGLPGLVSDSASKI